MARNASSLEHILRGLLPYSRENMLLSFKPHQFFSELEQKTKKKQTVLQTALSRAIRQGYVERVDGIPCLTEKGRARIQLLTATRLRNNVYLMVAFDIPEEIRAKRRKLRNFLQMHDFEQVQRSIWVSRLDYRRELRMVCDELNINEHVLIYECAPL